MLSVRSFLVDEAGGISLDWMVLTAVIVGTGFSIVSSIPEGLEIVAFDEAAEENRQIVQQSFGTDDYCAHGIDGLKAREAARVANGGGDPVDVTGSLRDRRYSVSDTELRRERERLAGRRSSNGEWTRENTIAGLVDCDFASRGLD
ncbi:hypothetical protein MWU52_09740 [Jannaschia sp. S6380]|uniref:hypothetical protein n=1 Tax=Jannaschia sp. S6380 TaxID=2926408 RepID=UPI001FF39BB9|nr:hypothetical protein [Jannaschia sp. S6380]MCK0167828.1 hypothetical protein [Jannaschia sp. S6380]